MKVFLSYSSSDKDFANRLAGALRARGMTVWFDPDEAALGGNLIERINQGITQADALVVVLSEDYGDSQSAQNELSTWRLTEAAHHRKIIVPLRIDDSPIPLFLADRVSLDMREESFDAGVAELAAVLEQHDPAVAPAAEGAARHALPDARMLDEHRLKREYARGNLALFCGAGASIAAGIPGWDVLLRRLLTRLFRGEGSTDLAAAYQDYFGTSPIIVAQFLKNALGQDYRETMRRALYSGNPEASPLLDAICDLCRPQRSRASLHSIVTFNFDDLLEHNLARNKIACRAIYAEGQQCEPHQLPIYHVHGYLPRDGTLSADSDLVFSEDAYHSQFVDPFSWSNLAQLSHLSNQTCLFVGLSMTDPNLRRLLDVSMRKNPDKRRRHYVFRRRYDPAEMLELMRGEGSGACDAAHCATLIDMAHILEEQDANHLGLNVIWVDSYDEIPPVIADIAAVGVGR